MTTSISHLGLALFLILLNFCACSTDFNISERTTAEEEEITSKSYSNVEQALWPFFESFEEEARLRNLDIDLNDLGITGVISNITDDGVAGTCQSGLHIHHVTVDQNFWQRSSNLRRELIVYHELGHCALGRAHLESEDNNGHCLSLMNSGTTDCNVLYNVTNREYYINELFSTF